jgi:hypothetical protein
VLWCAVLPAVLQEGRPVPAGLNKPSRLITYQQLTPAAAAAACSHIFQPAAVRL